MPEESSQQAAGDHWESVKLLFAEALEQPPEARQQFVGERAAGNQQLRTEVEALLKADSQDTEWLSHPIFAVATHLLAVEPEDLAPEVAESSTRVGPYRILRPLDHGGMATVYLVERDDGQYRQRCALKMAHPSLASQERIESRFRQERQIIASLSHPNIARLLDGGIAPDRRPYLVMELVEGEPLDRYCKHHQLTVTQRLDIFRKVCAAVQHAHGHLVIHCDLKPGNILVTADGEPKLLDFGVASLLDTKHVPHFETVLLDDAMMTPSFASPEQIRGDRLTTASDIYSLGVLLYLLLCGQRPHSFGQASRSEIERILAEQIPPLPSTACTRDHAAGCKSSVERLQRELRGDLDLIVLKALASEAEHRYDSVYQLSEDLHRHLIDLPVLARTETLSYRAEKFIRRHWIGVTSAVLIAFSLLTGITLALWQARQAEQSRQRAVAEQRSAEELAQFLEQLFSEFDLNNTRDADLTFRAVLDEAAAATTQRLPSQPRTQARLSQILGDAYRVLGLTEKAEKLLVPALEARRALFGEQHSEVAKSLNSLALLRYDQARLEPAERLARKALADREALPHQDDDTLAESWNTLGLVLEAQGRLDLAEAHYRHALNLRRASRTTSERRLSESLNNLGSLLGQRGQLREARSLLSEALSLRRHLYGEHHLRTANSLNNLAIVHSKLGETEIAEQYYTEAIELYRELGLNQHSFLTHALVNLAELKGQTGNRAEAIELCREAIAIAEEEEHRADLAVYLMSLGVLLHAEARFSEAGSVVYRAMVINQETLGRQHPDFGNALFTLYEILRADGRLDEAATHLRTALIAWQTHPPTRGWHQPYTQGLLSEALEATGHPREAARWRSAALAGLAQTPRANLATRFRNDP